MEKGDWPLPDVKPQIGGVVTPAPPRVRLSLGVTGHRESNPALAANRVAIEATLGAILDEIEAAVGAEPALLGPNAPTRLHSMLADGVDQMTAHAGIARGWELVAPLPFGRSLNAAINALPESESDARALLGGELASTPDVQARAQAIGDLYLKARVFELADRDEMLSAQFLAKLAAPGDAIKARTYTAAVSDRVALAARVMIEQSDILLAIWDGAVHNFVGGARHTIASALELGAPVIWIDANAPHRWRILRTPESMALRDAPVPDAAERAETIKGLVRAALRPMEPRAMRHGQAVHPGARAIQAEQWRPGSNILWHAYRRIEAIFGDEKGASPFRNLHVTYETPDTIAQGSGAEVLNAARTLPGGDTGFAERIELDVLRRFAWADGVSSHLSDLYRGGMVASFVLSSLAIVSGIAYLPFATSDEKGYFAAAEFALLAAILIITWLGQEQRWHGRWFETRRVAEYFRHSPLLLALGVARPPGRWPKGAETSWPEWYARHGLRDVGLPEVAVTSAYLRAALVGLLDAHVVRQRDYHHAKVKRLAAVHHNLDRLSETLFQLAVVSVAVFLVLIATAQFSVAAHDILYPATKMFTFLGVMLPTFGAAVAGIRYFGDFERFAAISEITAEKLDALHARIALLLSAGDAGLEYAAVADLAHAADEIVVTEIENWQAVFGGKHVTVPV